MGISVYCTTEPGDVGSDRKPCNIHGASGVKGSSIGEIGHQDTNNHGRDGIRETMMMLPREQRM